MAGTRTTALTSIRFFAAAAIVLHHSQDDYFFSKGTFEAYNLDRAVQLFFALSGFVLAINADKYASYADFMVARFARIWPAHLCGLLLCVGLLFPGHLLYLAEPSQVGMLAINLGLLQAWVPDMKIYFSYNAPSWSISCELFFYLMFLPLFWFLRKNLWLCTPLLAIGLGLVLWIGNVVAASFGITDDNWLQYINPVVNLPIFALGIFTGMLFTRLRFDRMPFVPATLIQAAALFLVLISNHLPPLQGTSLFGLEMGRFGDDFKAAIYCCLMFYTLCSFDGGVSRALSARPLVYLGDISYSIYMIHQTIIVWVASTHQPLVFLPLWGQWVGCLAIILALAAASHALLERPLRYWIIKLWKSARRAKVDAVTA